MYTPSNLWLGGAEGLRPQPAASNASATRATTRKTRPAIFIHSHLALSTRRGRSTASPPPQPLLYDTEACSSVLVSVNTGLGFAVPPAIGQAGTLYTARSEEHTSELQSHHDLVCRLLLEKKKKT